MAPDNSALNRPVRSALLMRAAVGLAAGLAILASGCILPFSTIPMIAPGYGQTYKVVDEAGQPVGDGLLYMRSEYEHAWFKPPRLYGCYEIKDGKAAVPWKWGTRLEESFAMGPQLLFGVLEWSNPDYTEGVPLVPGYVLVPSSQSSSIDGVRLGGIWPTGVLRLKKAGPPEECDYLLGALDFRVNEELHFPSAGGGYSEEDRAADEAAVRRAMDYAVHRLTELGYPPGPEWFGDKWVRPWRDAKKPP